MLPKERWKEYREISSLTVGEYLRLYLFVIPQFQSPYRWKKSQAKIFLKKINDLINGVYNLIPPSLNMITVYVENTNEKEKRNILDGFQRTITMILFICVIRDLLLKLGNHSCEAKKLADSLHHDYVYKFFSLNNNDKIYKLEFHKRDFDFVKNIILEPWDSPSRKKIEEYKKINTSHKRESCKNMFSVYRYLFTEVENLLKVKATPLLKLKHLETILNVFLNQIELELKTYIGVGLDYTINTFTEMNQSVATLNEETEVKGALLYACSNSSEQHNVVNTYERMMDRFCTNTEINSFFNYRSIAYFGKSLTKESISESIIQELRNSNVSPLVFVKELDHVAEICESYFHPNEKVWNSVSIVNTLNCLNIGRFKQACPVAIAAKEYILNDELLDDLFKHILKVFTIRAIFDFNPNDTLPTMIKACKILRGEDEGAEKSDFEKVSMAKKVITKGILPKQRATKEEFLARINEPIIDNNKSSILLRLIESHITNEDVLYPLPQQVSVEHIRPKKLTEDWKDTLIKWENSDTNNLKSKYEFDEENWKIQSQRLGNKLLILIEPNKKFKNTAPYEIKRKYYAKSSFKLTKELKDIEKFSTYEFERRQKRLIGFLSEIFEDIFTGMK